MTAGTSILASAPPKCGHPLSLINEGFNGTRAIAERTVAHANNRQERLFPGGVIPHPIRTDVQPFRYSLSREERFDCGHVSRRLTEVGVWFLVGVRVFNHTRFLSINRMRRDSAFHFEPRGVVASICAGSLMLLIQLNRGLKRLPD
jgi:hypothetical protein